MSSVSQPAAGKAYWRSLDEPADTPAFRALVEAEFPGLAPALLSSASRRQFLKLMGASVALAGLTGCRWPEEKIAPYANRPEGRTPGVPAHYATAMELNGVAAGVLVTSYDGRPVKIEGNPSHPVTRGSSDAFIQASVLDLYDPDRSRSVIQRQGRRHFRRTWDEFAAFARAHFGGLRDGEGKGLAVLTEASSSPSFLDMRARVLQAFPRAAWYEYEPISHDNERVGAAMALGRPYRTHLHLDIADVVVCLDADVLMTHPAAIQYARDFVAGRNVDSSGQRRDTGGPMNRLYVVESSYSITGSMADHRLAVRSTQIMRLACGLVAELEKLGSALAPPVAALGAGVKLPAEQAKVVRVMARDLVANQGRGVVAVGPRQPAALHGLGHVLNAVLGNAGRAVTYTAEPDDTRPTHVEAIASLAAAMREGTVDTLVILGGNPVFDAPADLEFNKLLSSVTTSVHLSLYRNETSRATTWHLPRAHYLESWGDARAYEGTVSVVQPLIEPLYGGRTPVEALALVLDERPLKAYDIVRRTLKKMLGGSDFETRWRRVLHDGVVAGSGFPAVTPRVRSGPWVIALAERTKSPTPDDAVEIVFCQDARVDDGRFANNGWLQEMPDPMTKLTWDNAALLSPVTADALDIKSGDGVKLAVGDRELEIPALVMPGQAPGSVTLPLGYGRTAAGRVGNGTGFNTYALRTSRAMHTAPGATVSKTARRYTLAVTQDHHAIASKVGEREKGARIGMLVREADVEEYKAHPAFARGPHAPEPLSLWQEPTYDTGHKWAMSIDLNACIGCGACVVACQAENNTPVVGKEEVDRGREMHWIRIDRYFAGAPASPRVAHQPVTCHHCENAPCEQVCPVAATVHSEEGLNDMVYNRCIGTRYCSNNCPYKVRRFNWFNNYKNRSRIERMVLNPEVTTRGRGVMEKCTYCVQRINAVKIAAKNDRRPIRDGEIIPACAQACPTRAIVFGDLNDPQSRVAELHAADRSYAMLAELNVQPRTKYLARLRNPAGRVVD